MNFEALSHLLSVKILAKPRHINEFKSFMLYNERQRNSRAIPMISPLFQVSTISFTISLALGTALADCNCRGIQGNKINGEAEFQMQEEGPKME